MRNPWEHFTAEDSEFVPAGDREAVDAYRQAGKARRGGDYALYTNLPPTPFLGDPSAPVVLLSRNPSFDPQDSSDYQDRDFRDAAIRNLTHSITERPFFALDTSFANTASYLHYWKNVLGDLTKDATRAAVARGVACFNAFPYHALKYDYDVTLHSQRYTTHLVRQALTGGLS